MNKKILTVLALMLVFSASVFAKTTNKKLDFKLSPDFSSYKNNNLFYLNVNIDYINISFCTKFAAYSNKLNFSDYKFYIKVPLYKYNMTEIYFFGLYDINILRKRANPYCGFVFCN